MHNADFTEVQKIIDDLQQKFVKNGADLEILSILTRLLLTRLGLWDEIYLKPKDLARKYELKYDRSNAAKVLGARGPLIKAIRLLC